MPSSASAPPRKRRTAGPAAERVAVLEAMLDGIPQGLCVVDSELRLRIVNARFGRLFRLPETLTRPGTAFADVLRHTASRGDYGPVDVEAHVAERLRALRGTNAYRNRRTLPDGRVLEIEGASMGDVGYVITYTDVTDRAEVEQLATQAHERLRDAISTFSEGFALWDRNDRLMLCNDRYRELYRDFAHGVRPGISYEEHVRARLLSPRSMVPADQVEARVRERIEQRRRMVPPFDVERAGDQWIRVIDRRTKDGGIVSLRIDISDIKRRERELGRQSRLLQAILETMSDGLIAFDGDDRLITVNDRALAMFDVDRDVLRQGAELEATLRAVAASGFFGPGDPETIASERAAALRARPNAIEQLVRDDGAFIEIRRNPMPDGGFVSTFTDVTARRTAERDREHLSRVLFDAVESIPQGIALFDAGQRLVLCNTAFSALYDKPPAAMVGVSITEVARLAAPMMRSFDGVPVDSEGAWIEARVQRFAAAAKEPVEVEFKDGRWFLNSDHPTGDGGVVFVRTDITEQKQAQARLRESEQRFRDIAESHPLPLTITRVADGKISYANVRAAEMVRGTVAQLLGMNSAWFYADEGVRDEVVAELRARRAVDAKEVRFRRLDGSTFWLALTCRPIAYDGDPSIVSGFYELTERKAMEQALRDSEQRFRGISEAHPVPVVIVRLSDGVMVYASQSLASMMGVPDCVGLRAAEFYADPAERARFVAAVTASGFIENFEVTGKRADGSVFPAALTSRRITWDGEPALVTGILDLTERKRAEAEIARQREALAHSEKLTALGSLLAGVAHELNNPLSVVVGQSAMLQDMTTDPKIAARAERIRRAADRCARIVKTFLAMARRRPPELQRVDLNAVVDGAVELVAYAMRTADIAIEQKLDPDLPLLVADPDQLGQVATNLLVNAQQALMDRPLPRRVAVATRHEPAANAVVLTVADNGAGVPPEIRSRIFEPFFTTKPTGVGTGVGLSMCHGVVEGHGGSIVVDDTPGGGATFTVTLPVRSDAELGPKANGGGTPVQQRTGSILIVDDEAETALTLAEILRSVGHKVETVENGAAALERLAAQPFDLILSDLRMPVLDGPGLYRALAERQPDLLSRIVFVTGDTLAPHVNAFLAKTRVTCIEKPVDPRIVRDMVARQLAGQQ